jgi:hypothetical protein
VDPASIGAAYVRRSSDQARRLSDQTRRSSRASLGSSVYVSAADTQAATQQDLGLAQRDGTQTVASAAATTTTSINTLSTNTTAAASQESSEVANAHAQASDGQRSGPATAHTGASAPMANSTTACTSSRATADPARAANNSCEEERSCPGSPGTQTHADAFAAAGADGDTMHTPDRQQDTRRRVLMDLLSPSGSGLVRRGVTPRGTSRRGSALRRCQSLEKLTPQLELEDCADSEQVSVAPREESPEGIDILFDFPTIIPREAAGPAGKSSKATSRTSSQATIIMRQRPMSLAALPLAPIAAPPSHVPSKHSLLSGFSNVTSLLEQATGPDAMDDNARSVALGLSARSSAMEMVLPGQTSKQHDSEGEGEQCQKVSAPKEEASTAASARPAPLSSAASFVSCHESSQQGGATLVVIEVPSLAQTGAASSLSYPSKDNVTATRAWPNEQDTDRGNPVGSLGVSAAHVHAESSAPSGADAVAFRGGDTHELRRRPRSTMFGMLRKVFARRSISIEHLDAPPSQQPSQEEADQIRSRSTTMDSALRPKRPGKRSEPASGSSERGRLNTTPSSARVSVNASRSSSHQDAPDAPGPVSSEGGKALPTVTQEAMLAVGATKSLPSPTETKHACGQLDSSSAAALCVPSVPLALTEASTKGLSQAPLVQSAGSWSCGAQTPSLPTATAGQAAGEEILQTIEIEDGDGPDSPERTSGDGDHEQQPLTARRAPPSYPSQNQLLSLRVARPSEQEVSCFSITGLDDSEIIL